MLIAGLQKTTLIDYPGKVAATVFTRGCSFRCGYCHNPELVLPDSFLPEIPQEEVLSFLKKRKGKLEAVCITGGEPLIFVDTKDFIRKVKAMGYLVKLDTNGSFPDQLEKIIKDKNVDYIAMDIKAAMDKYELIVRVRADISNVKNSINLIMNSGIDYEFRTTVVKPLHRPEDFYLLGQAIKGAKRYFIQNFVKSKHIDQSMRFLPFSEEELAASAAIVKKFVKEVKIR